MAHFKFQLDVINEFRAIPEMIVPYPRMAK